MFPGIAGPIVGDRPISPKKIPVRYDISWWRGFWKRTQVQGVIINAGGIVAYYPSRFPLHRRAAFLGDRDLYGELARAAHEDGLVVLARMDSNRADETFYQKHNDWFAVDSNGKPYRAGELYVACVNSPYYEEHIPGILQEIIEHTHPEGITDNSWSGLGRGTSATAGTVVKVLLTEPENHYPPDMTGMIRSIVYGSPGTTPGAWKFGIAIIGSPALLAGRIVFG